MSEEVEPAAGAMYLQIRCMITVVLVAEGW